MPQKRMFSLKIVDTDAFLEMPSSSQLLYFHLSMRADDEGFVGSPRKIMRMGGFSDDDFKILVAKRFVLTFESGVVVIKHWLIHNNIRQDRLSPTKYIEEKKLLRIKENGAYTEMSDKCLTNDGEMSAQIRLDKVRLDKVSIDTVPSTEDVGTNKIFEEFYKINPGINFGNTTQRKAANWLIGKFGLETALSYCAAAISAQGKPYAPTITTPHQLKEKLGELKIFYDKSKSNQIVSI